MYVYWYVVIALDEMHSSAVVSFACIYIYFFYVAVGVSTIVERDQSAPARTATPAGGVTILQGCYICRGEDVYERYYGSYDYLVPLNKRVYKHMGLNTCFFRCVVVLI